MTTFPGSPRLLKGGIIGLDPFNPVASIIIFQYNPEKLSRTLNVQEMGGKNKDEALRLCYPPEETISLDLIIDAADQLEKAFPTTSFGIYPALAALEMLLYPKIEQVLDNNKLAAAGIIEVIQPEAPLTLFVWGFKRALPVRITKFSITEEFFDPNLNPIRAKVELTLRVLTYQDLGMSSVGGSIFMANQVVKEVMATFGSLSNILSVVQPGGT